MTKYDELKKAAEAAIGSPTGYVERGANYAYEKLATPENILNLIAEREKLQTEKDNAYTLLERMTQDKDCAWQNVHILERERQKQDARVEKLLKVVEAAKEILEAVRYNGESDEIGERVCCHELSYLPHAADCKLNTALKELDK